MFHSGSSPTTNTCKSHIKAVALTPGAGRGVALCTSSILFTLDVVDLVFMVRAGDGEIGGDGESSPAIMGIDSVGPTAWLVVWREGGAALRVLGTGGVVSFMSAMGPVSSSCCGLVLCLLVLLDSSEGGAMVGIMLVGRLVSGWGGIRWLVYILWVCRYWAGVHNVVWWVSPFVRQLCLAHVLPLGCSVRSLCFTRRWLLCPLVVFHVRVVTLSVCCVPLSGGYSVCGVLGFRQTRHLGFFFFFCLHGVWVIPRSLGG